MELAEFALLLPKAELHVHLDGTLEPQMKLDLAARNGIALAEKTAEEVLAKWVFHDLPSFLAVHYPNMNVLLTEDDYYDLCSAYLKKASEQGVLHAEMFFDPQLHTSRGVGFGTIVAGYRRAIADAKKKTGISATLVMCVLRDWGAEYGMATLLESLPYKDDIVGIGLDSDEKGHPPVEFSAIFARARQEGYRLTMHCDIDQIDSVEHIRQALEDIGVERIDHGANIVESPELMDYARERGIGFTACPLSNGYVVPDMKAHEILTMLDAGLFICLNSDDPPLMRSYVGDNYAAFGQLPGVDRARLARLAANSFRASWISVEDRDRYVAEVDAFLTFHGAGVDDPTDPVVTDSEVGDLNARTY